MVLVSRHPPLFPQADDIHRGCGPHQLRAVVRAFGRDALISELYYSPRHYRNDWSLPWQLPRILSRHEIPSRLGFWPRRSFAPRLASALAEDRPTLFLINSIRGSGSWHWISAWGHDPEAAEFICYDSQAPTTFGTHRGNTRYHADLLTASLPWRGTFALTIDNK